MSMSFYYFVYYLLILVSCLLSFVAFKWGHKRFLYLSLMLFLAFLLEIGYDVPWFQHKYSFAQNFFVLFEYSLTVQFIIPEIKLKKLRGLISLSIPVFILCSLIISYVFYKFKSFPAINIEIETILLLSICIYLLFNLDIDGDYPIRRNSNFWILTGFLIFFGGTFFFFGVYANLVALEPEKAKEYFGKIVQPLNIVLYSCINTGILCLLVKRKVFMQ
jgi:hypothetical protein